MPNSVAIGRIVGEAIYRFFKMAAVRHLGFFARVRTTYEEYWVIVIIVQNLVGINAIISITWKF